MKLAVAKWSAEIASEPATRDTLGTLYARFGDKALVVADHPLSAKTGGQALDREVAPDHLYLVVQKGRLFQQQHPDVDVLLDKGRFLAVAIAPERAERLATLREPSYQLRQLEAGTTVFEDRPAGRGRSTAIPWVEALVRRVDRSALERDVIALASRPTRHSLSSHYAAAAEWGRVRLASLGYRARTQRISVDGSFSLNVVGDRRGTGGAGRGLVLLTAHLDSVNEHGGPQASAPGADDNATGSAALLEIARVLALRAIGHDVRLVLFGGEEQGLDGSRQFVRELSSSDRARVHAVLNLDMIGSRNTPAATVLLEGASRSRSLVEAVADAAVTYTSLAVQTSFAPYASDHVAFLDAGLPALLAIEGADRANDRVHSERDTAAYLDYELLTEIARMSTAALALLLERGVSMSDGFDSGDRPGLGGLEPVVLGPRDFSGRYSSNGGATGRVAGRARRKPIATPDEPIFVEEEAENHAELSPGGSFDSGVNPSSFGIFERARAFSLHVDIDGPEPLNVVSGAVSEFSSLTGPAPGNHFIGRVISNSATAWGTRNLTVDIAGLCRGTDEIVRLEVELQASSAFSRTALATFIAASGRRYGPYAAARESDAFRVVEMDVDQEEGAPDVPSYDTHAHPDRPTGLRRETLSVASVFRRAGIMINWSVGSGSVVSATEAGVDARWSDRELHDSMTLHWDAFANVPQWKMWLFMAKLSDRAGLGGMMFDGDIDEPGGVDRQGTAIFTQEPAYHTVDGVWAAANPPAKAAVQRELLFNVIHESGHAYNLYHPFQRALDVPWVPSGERPPTNDPTALSWMNYGEIASEAGEGRPPGSSSNASWFYRRFRFSFDERELLFLRHAPERAVQMGAEAAGQNHGRVTATSVDQRLEFVVRTRQRVLELGEPVFIELRLRNDAGERVAVDPSLDPSYGAVEVAVTDPDGERRPFLPFVRARAMSASRVLEPGEALYQPLNLTMGQFGFPFKAPGMYLIEASYRNHDGHTAAAALRVYVRPPQPESAFVVAELFQARVGRVLGVGGTRVVDDVTEKLQWVLERLDERHPARHYVTAALGAPLAFPAKVVEAKPQEMRILQPDPELAMHKLGPLLEKAEAAADAVGHIVYRALIDTYTYAAVEADQRSSARDAQEHLLELLARRHVIAPVIAEVEERARELR